jgi:hypothetical protein
MALRLRRGTDAERLTITPVESELVYTTDNKELFVGDGTTVGGNKIGGIIPQFLTDLNDVEIDSPQIGQVLKWNGDNWVASDDNNTGVVEGSNYRINIVGDDSLIIVNSDTNTFTGKFVGNLSGSIFNVQEEMIVDSEISKFTGTFVGDGSGLTNLPIALDGSGIIEGSNYRINIIGDDSTVLVNTSTNTFTGIFEGDGSGLTNLPIPEGNGIVEGSNYKINIIGDDSTILVNTTTNTFTGTFVGDGSGLTNLPAPSELNFSVFDLNDVFIAPETTPEVGETFVFDGGSFTPQKISQVIGINGETIVDGTSDTFTGNFVGDGSGLTNLPALTELNFSVFDLNDMFITPETTPEVGDSFVFDGGSFTPQKISQVIGINGETIVDGTSDTFTGNFVGDGSGLTNLPIAGDSGIIEGSNYRINIIGDDSTVLVDTNTKTFNGTLIGDVNNNLIVTDNLQITDLRGGITILTSGTSNDDYSLFEILNYQDSVETSALTFVRGRGTIESSLPVLPGDKIEQLLYAAVSSDGTPGISALITVSVDSNGTVSNGVAPGHIDISTFDDAGNRVIGLSLDRNGAITVANNTLVAGVGSGQVDDSAVVEYLQVTVGSTTYAMPLYAIRP